jgi:hypothetical protein
MALRMARLRAVALFGRLDVAGAAAASLDE